MSTESWVRYGDMWRLRVTTDLVLDVGVYGSEFVFTDQSGGECVAHLDRLELGRLIRALVKKGYGV